MTQTFYGNQQAFYAGMKFGIGPHGVFSMVNDLGSSPQVSKVVIDNVIDSTAYTFSVNGIAVTFTSGVGTTVGLIRDGLIAAYRAIAALEAPASANPNGNDVQITAKVPGTAFTIADSDANLTTSTTTANVAKVVIPFGRAIIRASGTEKSARLPSATGQAFAGILERIHSNVDPSLAGEGASFGQDLSVVRRGMMCVEVDQTVAPGNNVFFRHTAGGTGLGAVGTFRTDADTARGDQITQAAWIIGTTGAGIAVVDLNIP